MKVYMHYEDNSKEELQKSLKITLPKSWKTGPIEKLLIQFIETYNSNEKFKDNLLTINDMHLCHRQVDDEDDEKSCLVDLPIDGITIELIPDRADLYVMHGPSQTLAEMDSKIRAAKEKEKDDAANLVQCTNFGCKKKFPRGGPYPTDCTHHTAPPVFHETAKFWSCCPNKKAYDWDDFQKIPGCQTGTCSEDKQDQKQFLGGTDLREQLAEGAKLKSIDDFNKAEAAGGTDAAPVLDRLQTVLEELGVERELYDQVVDGMKRELGCSSSSTNGNDDGGLSPDNPQLLESVAAELGSKLKAAMKAIAVEQLRIK